jgi:tail-anchored protein insertion receptor
LRKLKTDLLNTKTELLKTSAQDQFARWAKLRRSVDKGLADLEKLSAYRIYFFVSAWSLGDYLSCATFDIHTWTDCLYTDSEVASNKAAFSVKFKALIWSLTTGLQYFVGWWYRKSAVFYLPPGWFGPLGWWLSFPLAPAGESNLFP